MRKSVKSAENTDAIDGIIEIRDPEIQVEGIMAEIRENMAKHERTDPVGHERMLAEERLGMRSAIDLMRKKIEKYGDASSLKHGVARRAEIFVKKAVRKLLQRHIDQQHDVNQSVLDLMAKLVPYLDQQAKNHVELLARIQKLEERLNK